MHELAERNFLHMQALIGYIHLVFKLACANIGSYAHSQSKQRISQLEKDRKIVLKCFRKKKKKNRRGKKQQAKQTKKKERKIL